MRFFRFVLKAAVLGLLIVAMFNPTIQVGTAKRCRVYLVDRSQSVQIQHSAPGALRTAEVVQTINFDMTRLDPADYVGLALFGRTFAFQMNPRPRGEEIPVIADLTAEVDPGGSDIVQALRAVRLQMPSDAIPEVLLFSDGNFVDETVGATARALGINLYCIGVGDPQVKDVRILRVIPPRMLRDGDVYSVDVELDSTVSGPVTVTCATQSKQVPLVARRRAILRFDGLKAKADQKTIHIKAAASGFDDLCPENNQVQIDLMFEQRKPRLLVLTSNDTSDIGRSMAHEYDVKVSKSFEHPMEYHAVVLENFPAPPETSMKQLQQYVNSLGGGVVIVGGPKAFAANYAGTPIEKISPLWSFPDTRASIVFLLDASGSMGVEFQKKPKFQWMIQAVTACSMKISDQDNVAIVTFTDGAKVRRELGPIGDRSDFLKLLQSVSPNGQTHLAQPLEDVIKLFKETSGGVKHIILITDGELEDPKGEQTLDRFKKIGKTLKEENIGISVYLTGNPSELQRISELGGEMYRTDFQQLEEKLSEKIAADIRLFAERVEVRIKEHELTEGLRDFQVPWMNRLTLQREASLLATTLHGPAAAVWTRGSGKCAAFAYSEDRSGLVARAIRYVTSKREQAQFTSIPEGDRLRLRLTLLREAPPPQLGEVNGTYQHPRTGTTNSLRLVRVSEREFVGILERPLTGSYHLDVPSLQARGSVEVMCHPEVMNLGINVAALEAAGTLVSQVGQIQARQPSSKAIIEQGLRPWLAAAAMVLLLLELLLGAFWK